MKSRDSFPLFLTIDTLDDTTDMLPQHMLGRNWVREEAISLYPVKHLKVFPPHQCVTKLHSVAYSASLLLYRLNSLQAFLYTNTLSNTLTHTHVSLNSLSLTLVKGTTPIMQASQRNVCVYIYKFYRLPLLKPAYHTRPPNSISKHEQS